MALNNINNDDDDDILSAAHSKVPYLGDLAEAWPESTTLAGSFSLVLTNLVMLLVFYLLVTRRQRWDVGVLLLVTMTISIIYHACRAGFLCFIRYNIHQMLDHLFVSALIIYGLSEGIVRVELFKVPPDGDAKDMMLFITRVRMAVFFVFFAMSALCVAHSIESKLGQVFSIITPMILFFVVTGVTNSRVFYQPCIGWPGVVVFTLGVVFYAFMPQSEYEWAHSLWHVLAMLSYYAIFEGIQKPLPLPPASLRQQ